MDPIEELLDDDGELYDGVGLEELSPALEDGAPSLSETEDEELELL